MYWRRRRTASSSTMLNPLTEANLQGYWRSDQVAGGHGAAVASWPDLSANAWTLSQGTAANRPTLNVSSNTSPGGIQLVQFDGLDAPNNDFLSRAITWPALTLGYTFYFYGDMQTPVNANNGAIILADDTSQRPQLIYDSAGAGTTTGWRDTTSTKVGGASATGFQTLAWAFEPTPGTGTAYVERNGTVVFSAVHNLALGGAEIILGQGPDTVPMKMNLGALVLFNAYHNAAKRALIRAFLVDFFE